MPKRGMRMRRTFKTEEEAFKWVSKLEELSGWKKSFHVVRSTKEDTFFPESPRGKWAVREKLKVL